MFKSKFAQRNNKVIKMRFEMGEIVVFCGDLFHAGDGAGPANIRFFCYADADCIYRYGETRVDGRVVQDAYNVTYEVDEEDGADERVILSRSYFGNF